MWHTVYMEFSLSSVKHQRTITHVCYSDVQIWSTTIHLKETWMQTVVFLSQ